MCVILCAGLRGYLLAPRMSDWWALSDLIDLSLGAFSKMPGFLDRVDKQSAALAAAAKEGNATGLA